MVQQQPQLPVRSTHANVLQVSFNFMHIKHYITHINLAWGTIEGEHTTSCTPLSTTDFRAHFKMSHTHRAPCTQQSTTVKQPHPSHPPSPHPSSIQCVRALPFPTTQKTCIVRAAIASIQDLPDCFTRRRTDVIVCTHYAVHGGAGRSSRRCRSKTGAVQVEVRGGAGHLPPF